jgi:small subunit ribosomal protein S27Ae
MQVFLHHIDGSVALIDLQQFSSVEELLQSVGSSASRVVYQGAHLNSLESVENNANLYLTGDLEGGKKKKKKKVYTTKKKNKHIHKRVKMGIYSLYSVDGNF